ncbi:MAG: DUF2285 domain-containing protein [Pseudacidovorax sp.]|nr:DUF2285 domain-containing protein [Pseudacidovorax sp.]
MRVRRARCEGGVVAASAHIVFDLWRVPGDKQLMAGPDAVLSVSIGPRHARFLIDAGLSSGAPFVVTVPLTTHLRGQLAAFEAAAGLLEGRTLPAAHARSVGRDGRLHLRALQALDAMQAGASHRDLAVALFGSRAVRADWHADGALRAQVRHLIARAEGFMRGGYLGLAGLRPVHARAHGGDLSP